MYDIHLHLVLYPRTNYYSRKSIKHNLEIPSVIDVDSSDES